MSLRNILGFLGPKLLYSEESVPTEDFPLSPRAILLYDGDNNLDIDVGGEVKSGQSLSADFCSTVTGKVAGITELKWLEGVNYKAVEIETSNDDWDSSLQGEPDFQSKSPEDLIEKLKKLGYCLSDPLSKDTVIVNCIESDLLVSINEHILKDNVDNIKTGINLIKHITGAKKAVIAITRNLSGIAGRIAEGMAEVSTIEPIYPNGAPEILSRLVANTDKTYVVSAECLNAMVISITTGRPFTEKALTLIGKGNRIIKNLKVRIGTPISEVLKVTNTPLENNEKLILGGPMMGNAAYTTEFPVTAETDSIYIQGSDEITAVTDSPCINCGKCVSVCPQKLPINLISRYSEFAIFEKCEEFDINYCIECGLCAYVCTSRRPLVQLVQFAKNELNELKEKEEV